MMKKIKMPPERVMPAKNILLNDLTEIFHEVESAEDEIWKLIQT